MAYDQYKTVSNPLLYVVSMSSRVCSLLVAGVYLGGMADALINTALVFHLCFCGSNVINYFFCDLSLLFFFFFSVLLRYRGQWVSDIHCFGFYWNEYYFRSPCSYFYIILPVLKIHSAEGRVKAFTTCTFHLTAVSIFQGAMLFMYFRPSSSYSLDEDKMTSLFYTLVIPLLNSLIFNLWNKDVKEALVKLKAIFLNICIVHMCTKPHTYSNCVIKIIWHDTWETSFSNS